MGKIWSSLRKFIKMDDLTGPDRFLGCYLEEFQTPVKNLSAILEKAPELYSRESETPAPLRLDDPEKLVRGYIYNMESYLVDNVAKYNKCTGLSPKKLSKAATPFIDEATLVQGCSDASDTVTKDSGLSGPAEGIKSSTIKASGLSGPAELARSMNTDAASITMTTMYAGRQARSDLLRCVGHLAGYLTK